MHPAPASSTSVRSSSAQDARDEVDLALGFDRNSTKLLCAAEKKLSAANATFVDCVDRSGPRERSLAAEAVQMATGAHAFATSYQATCRDALAEALTELTAIAQSGSARFEIAGVSAEQVVVAEASAITAAAEAEFAAERHAQTVQAAREADNAVAAAAHTVALAADAARSARETSNRLAAESVADAARRTALEVQLRADELARATAATAAAQGGELAGHDRVGAANLAATIAAAAASKADETARAAGIVAQAVESAATALAVLNVAAAAATEQAVYDAAQSVEAVAHAAARGLAAASVRADDAATQHALNR
jgi:hypothetical protein